MAFVHTGQLRRRSVRTHFALRTMTVCVCGVFQFGMAAPLPQGGHFVAGKGVIANTTGGLDIAQSTSRGIIDWASFSIGYGRTVYIANGQGATLNRVTGHDLSLIEGQLKASGSVYLINPQGIIVGPHGVITTGGRFVGATLDPSNSAFMAGSDETFTGSGRGSIVNLGAISSTGADVFLISRNLVANAGKIASAKGSAELDVGSRVLLHDASTGQQVFVDSGSHGTVLNVGAIRAAQISLQAADGNVYALAGRNSALRATGTATRAGEVWLVASSGTVHARGDVVATNSNGTGGTVDTSAKSLDLRDVAVKAGQWTIESPTVTIDSGVAQALSRSLSAGTSVTATATGTGTGAGGIAVAAPIIWWGDASLALNADKSVTIKPHVTVANRGAGDLTLRADATGADNGGSVVNAGLVDWSHSIGLVGALYDMSGTYTPGAMKSNPHWSAAAFSGLLTQLTGYKLVNSESDLEKISLELGANYALGKDIYLIENAFSNPFVAIGVGTAAAFTGQFDGMGHTIDGLTMQPPITDAVPYEGMFYLIGSTGVVRNLNMTNAYLIASPDFDFAGGFGILAGGNSGLITHVTTSGSISAFSYVGEENIGGIVATNNGVIERSSSSADVGGEGPTGGLAGENNGLITQSFSTGGVFGDAHVAPGGLVGINSGTITQSYYTGALGTFVGGGLVGDNYGTISESYASVVPNNNEFGYNGGVVVSNYGTIASNVFWNVDSSGAMYGDANYNNTPAVGLSAAQMAVRESFGPTWNFSAGGVWALPAGASSPVLRWQVAGSM